MSSAAKKPNPKKKRDPESVMSDPSSPRSVTYQPTGTWSAFKGNAQRLWSDLKPEDLNVREGDYEEVINRIHGISGEDFDEIRTKLFSSPNV